jgi:hypothetical protein
VYIIPSDPATSHLATDDDMDDTCRHALAEMYVEPTRRTVVALGGTYFGKPAQITKNIHNQSLHTPPSTYKSLVSTLDSGIVAS